MYGERVLLDEVSARENAEVKVFPRPGADPGVIHRVPVNPPPQCLLLQLKFEPNDLLTLV